MTIHSFKKTVGIPDIDASEKDYTYYWQLWHHNWDDKDIETIEKLCSLPSKNILEVGCGDGRITSGLAEKCDSIIGVDLSEPLIAAAKARLTNAKNGNLKFELMDAQKLSFENETFDAVLFPWVLQMVSDPLQALTEAHRVLKSEGKVIIIALLDADYDDIINQFVTNSSSINPDQRYDAPLTEVFGENACKTKSRQIFKYFFESLDIAMEAFQYALDRWYGGIKLDEEGQAHLFEVLKDYQIGERVCLEFPANVYVGTK